MKNIVITVSLITLGAMLITDISSAMNNSRSMTQNRTSQQYQEASYDGDLTEDEGYKQPKKKKRKKNKNKNKKHKKKKDFYKISKVEAEQLVQKCPCAKEFVDKLKNDELQKRQRREQQMQIGVERSAAGNVTDSSSHNVGNNNYRQNNNQYNRQQSSATRGGSMHTEIDKNSVNSWKNKIDANKSEPKEDASSIRIELKPITTVAADQRRLDSIINRKPLDDASAQVFTSRNNTNDELAALLRKTKLSIGRQDVSLQYCTREMNNLKKDLEKYRQKFA